MSFLDFQNMLYVGGNLTVHSTPQYLASFDTNNPSRGWVAIGSSNATALPGPLTAFLYDSYTNKIIVAGQRSGDGSAYMSFWNGTMYTSLGMSFEFSPGGVMRLL